MTFQVIANTHVFAKGYTYIVIVVVVVVVTKREAQTRR